MEKFSKFVVKNKLLITGFILLLTIACVVAIMFVNINSDLFSYLPDDLPMGEGLKVMQQTFNMQGDAIVGVQGVTYEQMLDITAAIQEQPGLKAGGVVWIGMFEQMRQFDVAQIFEQADSMNLPDIFKKKIEQYKKDFKDVDMNAVVDEVLQNPDILKLFYPNYDESKGYQKQEAGTYIMMLQLSVQTSSPEALALIDTLDDQILKDFPHAVGGSSQITKSVFDSTIGEAWKYIIVAVLVMFIILLLMTSSLVEPFIFMITLGISIVLNMGSNIILPSVSVITFAASSILQLGLSMDYAIFLMHAYSDERKKTLSNSLAMERAIGKTFTTVLSSALTTVGGFLALFFMQFKIGADLGIVLAKGVFLSFITIILLQPCLMMWATKLHEKTSHKIYLPKFKRVGSFSVNHRKTISIIALLMIIPAVIMQQMVNLSYIKFTTEEKADPSQVEQVVQTMGNSLIVIAPAHNIDANLAFVEEIKKVDNVQATMSIYDMLPDKFHGLISDLATMSTLPGIIDKLPEDAAMLTGFVNKGKTMYSILLNCPEESDEAFKALTDVTNLAKKYFSTKSGEENFNITGTVQAVKDLKTITPNDFLIVNIVSILIILLVLVLTLKSFKLSVILIAIIELGIYINLALCFLLKQNLNFMAYIIISSIQLGATVDYAILYALKFKAYQSKMPSREAAYRALTDSGNAILTSVALMAGCCLSVSMVTSNRIVAEITLMIARGSIISGFLVMLVLPALLVVFVGNKKMRVRLNARTLKKLDVAKFESSPAASDNLSKNKKAKKQKNVFVPLIRNNLIDNSPISDSVIDITSKLSS